MVMLVLSTSMYKQDCVTFQLLFLGHGGDEYVRMSRRVCERVCVFF